MVTTRLLVELQSFKDAIKVLDTVVQENDELPEAWYNLAFCYFNLKKYLNASECCKNVKTQVIKLKLDMETTDPQILELRAGYEELSKAIAKALGKKTIDESDEEDRQMKDGEEDEEGYETLSEEDISGDEEDAQMKD